ncbi:MAG TPA: GNAT family N-acetyltransferase [bacterium]|nr:GNAT family N-acetyltransferase [bacterium]
MDDIPALRALCRAAVGSDDYVLGFLRSMVEGREAVAVEVSGQLVAMGGVTECADRALWIGQLRTHPGFRRRGYATMLLEHARLRALREGRPALRLFTGLRNPSRSLYRAYGFLEVAAFTRRAARALTAQAGRLRADPGSRALHGLWRESAYARAGHGYLAYRWHMLPLTLPTLRMLGRRGQVLVDGRTAVLAWAEEGERAAFASVLAGDPEGLRTARSAAGLLRRRTVEVFLPMEARILRWAEEAGYRRASWGRHLMLYERRIRRER